MELVLPLEQMTTAEKMRALETIWADLSRHDAELESPHWHEQVLHERQERVKAGQESYIDWEAAKAELRRRRS